MVYKLTFYFETEKSAREFAKIIHKEFPGMHCIIKESNGRIYKEQ